MKKILYIVLGVVIGAAATFFLRPKPASLKHLDKTDKVAEAPKGTISVEEAIILSDNWADENPTEFDTLLAGMKGGKKRTRWVSWSLDDIKDYLKYAKQESKKMGYTMTGIRVYLGNYGKKAVPSKRNRNTMFIAPVGTPNVATTASAGG